MKPLVAGSSPATATTARLAAARSHSAIILTSDRISTANVAAVFADFLPRDGITRHSTNLKTKIMENLLEILTNEDKSFNFPWWVYAFIMPMALVALMALASWIMNAIGYGCY